jgi:hypothetical protein
MEATRKVNIKMSDSELQEAILEYMAGQGWYIDNGAIKNFVISQPSPLSKDQTWEISFNEAN